MQLGFDVQIPDGLLAANALLAENSRQGFGAWSGTVHQGFGVVISHTSLGIKGSLYDGGIGSRCTGKERDAESGNDYFGARYYASSMGRFMSPDWSAKYEPVPYAKLDNPQTLNLYSYVRNNPLGGVDPDGHCCEDDAEEEVNESREANEELSRINETFNRREAAAADMREQQAVQQFNESHPGGYDDANGVSHVGPASRQDVEQMQAENRDKAFPNGSFSINDWSGYPKGAPKPDGPFRLLEGSEYDTARSAANKANQAIRRADPEGTAGKQIHEVKPVKFGGSPTDPANKVPLTPQTHSTFTNWWNGLMNWITH